jgi:hypothetical protein
MRPCPIGAFNHVPCLKLRCLIVTHITDSLTHGLSAAPFSSHVAYGPEWHSRLTILLTDLFDTDGARRTREKSRATRHALAPRIPLRAVRFGLSGDISKPLSMRVSETIGHVSRNSYGLGGVFIALNTSSCASFNLPNALRGILPQKLPRLQQLVIVNSHSRQTNMPASTR